jgi:hypothetical protein
MNHDQVHGTGRATNGHRTPHFDTCQRHKVNLELAQLSGAVIAGMAA